MELTKHNYKEVLKDIERLLKDASFISFDTELSGLGHSLADKDHALDTPEERYSKNSKKVKQYGLIQIGISIFRFSQTDKKYLSATYTFYLCGKSNGSYRYDTSSMMFLADNNFNFNKLFRDGLTFISLLEESKIRNKREEKLATEDSSPPTPLKVTERKAQSFMKTAIEKVTKSKEMGKEPVLFLGKDLNGFYRKILFNNVASLFPTSVFRNQGGSERNIEVCHFDSEEDKTKFLDQVWEKEFSEQLGFTHIFKILLECGKPMVGHNLTYDLLHFVDKFVAPLPPTLAEFKLLVKDALPSIYDTKLISKDPPFSRDIPNTSLGCLFEELCTKYRPPEFDVESGCKSYQLGERGQVHDSGFDAFMTGACFIIMIKHLESKNWFKKEVIQSSHLKPYKNKIVQLCSYDIPYIDLSKPDAIPDRSFIYIIVCPSTWSDTNVRYVFACLGSYKTVRVDETHLYVIPQDDDDILKAKEHLNKIRKACPPSASVTMYCNPKAVGNGARSPTLSPSKHCNSPSKPSTITLKRSNADKSDQWCDSESPDGPSFESARNLKRLKSVGSEQFSNLTLESPVCVEEKLATNTKPDSQVPSEAREIFSVSENW